MEERPTDPLYVTWTALVQSLVPSPKKFSFLDALACASRDRKDLHPSHILATQLLNLIPETIETNWIKMEIALSGRLTVGSEIEPPEYYAT